MITTLSPAMRSAYHNPLRVDVKDPDLVLYLPFWYQSADMIGDTIYSYDKNRHTGTVTGATRGIQGRTFNGTTDIINIPNNAVLNPTTSLTLAAWVKVDRTTAPADYDGIICKRDSVLSTGYMLYTSVDKFAISAYATGNNLDITASISHTLGVWYFVVLVVDAGNATLYIDNISRGTDTCN